MGLKSILLRDMGVRALRRCEAVAVVGALLMIPILSVASSDLEVVARGDGFEVTRGEVDALIKYMAASHFASTEEQNVKAAVKLKLFSVEARAIGLGPDESSAGQDTVEEMVALSKLYIKKLMGDYVLSDVAIESYYRAHPEMFPQTEDGSLAPDDPLRKEIRAKIMASREPILAREAYNNLMKKYHVKFLSGQGATSR